MFTPNAVKECHNLTKMAFETGRSQGYHEGLKRAMDIVKKELYEAGIENSSCLSRTALTMVMLALEAAAKEEGK